MAKDKEYIIKITRGSGPGGQHKNKVETCVVITHVPTGIQERCQDTRSKNQNIKIAKDRIEKRLQQIEVDKIQEEKNKERIEKIHNPETIRTYNFIRNEVIDHRTKIKHNLKKFMRGEIDL